MKRARDLLAVTVVLCGLSAPARGETPIEGVMKLDPVGVDAYLAEKYAVAFPRFLSDAQKGKLWGMFFVGEMLMKGQGVPQNHVEANKWFRRAAEKGHAEAMASLAKSYEDGAGVAPNIQQALKWYQAAAGKGSTTAMLSLGLMHAHGRGLPQDYGSAAKWFKACAERGIDVCMVSLGNYMKSGLGLEKDLISAYAWFNLAASKSGALSDVAASSRDEIGRELSREQIAKAQDLSSRLARAQGK